MASFSQDDVIVGRVVSEDDDFLLVEFPKSPDHKFHLDENREANRFLTMLYVKMIDGQPVFGKPWDDE